MVQTRPCTALNLIDEIASNCYWSQLLSLILVLVSTDQRNNIYSRSYSHLEDWSVWGPVDGRSWLWRVIDNVVWTDSRLSIAGAGCGLICVDAGEEWTQKVYALQGLWGVERQVGSARGTRWPVGSSVGRMVARKARQSRRSEPVQGSGSQPKSTCGVYGGSPQNRSGYLVEPQNLDQRLGGRRRDPSAPRSFDADGHIAGSQGLHRDDTDCSEGVVVRWKGVLDDIFAPEWFVSQLKC
jgi:hypothetical protein